MRTNAHFPSLRLLTSWRCFADPFAAVHFRALRYCMAVVSLLCAGCTDDFSPPSLLTGLRVLAVEAAPASGIAGETTELELVFDDAAPKGLDAAKPRPVEIVWLGGCNNPPGGEYFACHPGLERIVARLSGRVLNTPAGTLPAEFFGTGSRFSASIPADILKTRPRRPTDAVHYGVSFVFFALCAGELRPQPDSDAGVPLGCFVPGRQEEVASADFEVGFATIYTFEGVVNQNPSIESVKLAGQSIPSGDCEEDADCRALSSTRFESACNRHGRCIPVVDVCRDEDACEVLSLVPKITPKSVEPDVTASTPGSPTPDEILWINYFGSGGEFEQASRLVNDRRGGFQRDFSGNWSVPTSSKDSIRLWSVLRDNRGGVAVNQIEIMVR